MFATPSFSNSSEQPNTLSDSLPQNEPGHHGEQMLQRQKKSPGDGPLPLLQHVDFLLYLARKMGKTANFMTPFPKLTEAELKTEVLAYNQTHPKVPVCTHHLAHQYEQLRNVCQTDGGPLYRSNSEQVTIKDIIEQSLVNLNENAKKSRDYLV